MSCQVKVNVKLDPQFKSMLFEDIKKAAMLTIEDARDDVVNSQTIPKDGGELEKSAFTRCVVIPPDIIATLTYGEKYARYPYFGRTRDDRPMNFQTVNNPYARSHWHEPYRDGEFLKKHFEENLKKVREGG